MKTILLKFAGPLQSWGTSSHFEKRHSDFYPSKSAVIGMIAAGLGYRRDEEEALRELNKLHFAVRIDQPGHVLRDYHTAHKYKANMDPYIRDNEERTYVTERYYIEDAVFVVAIGSEDDARMGKIETALKQPYFQLFLGRRSVPPTADFFLKVKTQDVLSALQEEEWHASQWYQKEASRELVIYSDADLADTDDVIYRRDKVISFSDKGRKYGFRREARLSLHPAEEETMGKKLKEHDAFAALGD